MCVKHSYTDHNSDADGHIYILISVLQAKVITMFVKKFAIEKLSPLR